MWFLCPCTFQFYCLFRVFFLSFFFPLSLQKFIWGHFPIAQSSDLMPGSQALSFLVWCQWPLQPGASKQAATCLYILAPSPHLSLSYSCFWLFCHFPVLVSIWASYSWWLDGSGSWLLDRRNKEQRSKLGVGESTVYTNLAVSNATESTRNCGERTECRKWIYCLFFRQRGRERVRGLVGAQR